MMLPIIFVLLILQCKNREYMCSNKFEEAQHDSVKKSKYFVDSQVGKHSSQMIDETLNLLHQDDPMLISILKEKYLIPPSDLPYNFSKTTPDLDGQYGQPRYIINKFYSVSRHKIFDYATYQINAIFYPG